MFKLLSGLILTVSMLAPGVQAATIECQGVLLKSVVVEGNRDDNHYFQNNLILTLGTVCGEKNRVHAALSHPAFSGFLSIALAAKTAGKKVNIAVNTSSQTNLSNQLAYISLPE